MAKTKILYQLIQKLGMKMSKFELECKISATTIKKSIDRDADLSTSLIEKIVAAFPRVNQQWLLTGEGDMFILTDEQKIQQEENKRLEMAGKIATGNMSIKVEDLSDPNIKPNKTIQLPATGSITSNSGGENDNDEKHDLNHDKDGDENPNLGSHKTESEMNYILKIMDTQARATEKDAEARLLTARAVDRLTAILELREQRQKEGERMSVKPTEV